jgi:hypothetical protein
MTFTLADGTRAGIVPTRDLRAVAVKQLGVEWMAPATEVPVVFYVPNQQALHRVLARFGALNGAGMRHGIGESSTC